MSGSIMKIKKFPLILTLLMAFSSSNLTICSENQGYFSWVTSAPQRVLQQVGSYSSSAAAYLYQQITSLVNKLSEHYKLVLLGTLAASLGYVIYKKKHQDMQPKQYTNSDYSSSSESESELEPDNNSSVSASSFSGTDEDDVLNTKQTTAELTKEAITIIQDTPNNLKKTNFSPLALLNIHNTQGPNITIKEHLYGKQTYRFIVEAQAILKNFQSASDISQDILRKKEILEKFVDLQTVKGATAYYQNKLTNLLESHEQSEQSTALIHSTSSKLTEAQEQKNNLLTKYKLIETSD